MTADEFFDIPCPCDRCQEAALDEELNAELDGRPEAGGADDREWVDLLTDLGGEG